VGGPRGKRVCSTRYLPLAGRGQQAHCQEEAAAFLGSAPACQSFAPVSHRYPQARQTLSTYSFVGGMIQPPRTTSPRLANSSVFRVGYPKMIGTTSELPHFGQQEVLGASGAVISRHLPARRLSIGLALLNFRLTSGLVRWAYRRAHCFLTDGMAQKVRAIPARGETLCWARVCGGSFRLPFRARGPGPSYTEASHQLFELADLYGRIRDSPHETRQLFVISDEYVGKPRSHGVVKYRRCLGGGRHRAQRFERRGKTG
jgi:hypothetical protein